MAPTPKERLDKLLVDRGLCVSRAQAQALIMDGKVKVAGLVQNKPGSQVALDEPAIEVSGLQPYVSRGGLKLEKALAAFNVQPQGRVCLDIGASTGGFTDCLLQNGASKVVSVDVGYGQLDWRLRTDERVIVLEKTNIRELKPEQLQLAADQAPSLGVVDTSFISLKKVLPPLAALLSPHAEMLALLKPQFEHKDYLSDPNFKGVVRGLENHRQIMTGVLTDLHALLPEWQLVGLDFSPVTGPKGNIEYLLHYSLGIERNGYPPIEDLATMIQLVIEKSYEAQPRL